MMNHLDRSGVVVALAISGALLAGEFAAASAQDRVSSSATVVAAARAVTQANAELDTHLAAATDRLERLSELHARDYASWSEVAQQRCELESLISRQRSMQEFQAFLDSIDERITVTPNLDLKEVTLQLAAAQAAATGHLDAARAKWKKRLLELAAYEQLFAEGFATAAEVNAAKAATVHAEGLLNQLQQEQSNVADSRSPDCQLKTANVSAFVRLRLDRHAAEAADGIAQANLRWLEALDQRLTAVKAASPTRESDYIRLDIAWWLAERKTAQQKVRIQELEEARLLIQRRQRRLESTETCAEDFESPADQAQHWSALLSERLGATASAASIATRGYQESRTVALQPADTSSATSFMQFQHRELKRDPQASTKWDRDPTVRFDPPSYGDWYQNGIRRVDIPAGQPRANSYGGPWYFPGATTNFR